MLRPISICALLCSIAHQAFGTPPNETTIFTRVIETRLPNPTAVIMDSTLYTISKTNRTLSVNSSEATCKLAVDPFDENVQGRIRALPLRGARRILVWGIQNSNVEGAVKSTYYTLLIVDPLGCSYKVVPLPEDRLPTGWPLMLPQLVVYDKIFYVFFPTHQRCAPCSFDENGRDTGMSSSRQLRQQTGVPRKQFWVKEFFSDSYKYLFHAYNFENGTALIELVDDYWFRTVTAVYVDHPVDAASVAYGTYQNTAICYVSSGDRREVTCARLNTRMVPGMTWKLPASDLPVSEVSIEVDKVGNTFVGMINSEELRFFVYNVDGLLVADHDFGRIGDYRTGREVNGLRFADEYCLDAVVYLDRDARVARHVVKCVDVKKYIGLAI